LNVEIKIIFQLQIDLINQKYLLLTI
jgi:hypothetical protein